MEGARGGNNVDLDDQAGLFCGEIRREKLLLIRCKMRNNIPLRISDAFFQYELPGEPSSISQNFNFGANSSQYVSLGSFFTR